jgi:hypothetical protein
MRDSRASLKLSDSSNRQNQISLSQNSFALAQNELSIAQNSAIQRLTYLTIAYLPMALMAVSVVSPFLNGLDAYNIIGNFCHPGHAKSDFCKHGG